MIASAARRLALRTMLFTAPRKAIYTARPLIQTPLRKFSAEDKPSYIKEMTDSAKDWEAAMAADTPVIIQAGASWCSPCVMFKPILLDAVKKHGGKVSYLYVDVDQHQDIAQMLQVQSIPICFMVANGNLVDSLTGLRDEKAVEDLIQKGLKAIKN